MFFILSGAPKYTWLLALKYVANIMNMTAVQSLDWKTPLERLTNQVPDTSMAMLFQVYDKVYFKAPKGSIPSDTVKKKGYFVGFAHAVGHAMTFKVLDATTLKIINKSIIRQAREQCNLHIDPDFSPTQTPAPFLLSNNTVLSLPHLLLCSACPVIRICSRGDCCQPFQLLTRTPSTTTSKLAYKLGSHKMGSNRMGSIKMGSYLQQKSWTLDERFSCPSNQMVNDFEQRSFNESTNTRTVWPKNA
jgi:hypothetical protein